MSYDSLLIHDLVIERPRATDDGAGDPIEDELGHPLINYAVIAELRGLVQPKGSREMALISDQGAEVGDHRIFLPMTDITVSDRIRFAADASRFYEVRGVQDAAGRGHHLEVDARMIKTASLELGS